MKTELRIHDPAKAKAYFEDKLAFTTGPVELDRMVKEGANIIVVDVRAEEDFAKDLAQAVLVSHLEMITAILNFLGVPHENGFFAKDMDPKPHFTEGWEDRVYEKFHENYPEPILLFYMNHLRWELLEAPEVYRPASTSAA